MVSNKKQENIEEDNPQGNIRKTLGLHSFMTKREYDDHKVVAFLLWLVFIVPLPKIMFFKEYFDNAA